MKQTFRLIKAKIAYMYAKFKADQLNKVTGKRQFVLMTDNGKLVVMDKSLFYKMRKRGSMPLQITPRMLPRISVYYTAGTYNGASVPCMQQHTALKKRIKFLNYIRKL